MAIDLNEYWKCECGNEEFKVSKDQLSFISIRCTKCKKWYRITPHLTLTTEDGKIIPRNYLELQIKKKLFP